ARDISTSNYTTIGPTIRFLVSKEIEIRNLRIIAKGIGEQLPLENIKPLLIVEEK
ncbi:MAG TPA: V-type ATP synthase subunit C, partial [Thermoplasmatales archaeon]|nr:V-type ATP synthase subunit C [Thermoplasmatales archaeon]